MEKDQKKKKKQGPLIKFVVVPILLTIFIGACITPIVFGLYEFISQMEFRDAIILYTGISGLMIAVIWVLLGLSIYAFTQTNIAPDTKKEKVSAAFLGAGFFVLWIAAFHYFEKPLTLAYVNGTINAQSQEYVFCDAKNKTASKSQYSQVFVFARKDIGCEPYAALRLKKLDTKNAKEKIQKLNSFYE